MRHDGTIDQGSCVIDEEIPNDRIAKDHSYSHTITKIRQKQKQRKGKKEKEKEKEKKDEPPLQAIDFPKVCTLTSILSASPRAQTIPLPEGPYRPVEWAFQMR